MAKWIKEDLEIAKLLLESGLSYKEIGLKINKSDMSVRAKLAKEYNIKRLDFYSFYIDKKCLNCNEIFTVKKGSDRKYNHKFCCHSCSATYNNKLKTTIDKNKNCLYCNEELYTGTRFCNNTCFAKYEQQNLVENWLKNEDEGIVNGGSLKIKSAIRKYVMDRADNKCQECGINKINQYSNKSILTIDHIDGNAGNNRPDNLKVLCPNCHAMTSTYGFINGKVSARKAYRKKFRPGINDEIINNGAMVTTG